MIVKLLSQANQYLKAAADLVRTQHPVTEGKLTMFYNIKSLFILIVNSAAVLTMVGVVTARLSVSVNNVCTMDGKKVSFLFFIV